MDRLHLHLRKHSSWYDFWHNEKHHAKLHWVIFILVGVLIALALGVAGIFQDWIRALFRKPKLNVEIKLEPREIQQHKQLHEQCQ
jgi:undecaprenyl pyrophosphate phosphatase UppP